MSAKDNEKFSAWFGGLFLIQRHPRERRADGSEKDGGWTIACSVVAAVAFVSTMVLLAYLSPLFREKDTPQEKLHP